MRLAVAINRALREAKQDMQSRHVVLFPTPFPDGTNYGVFCWNDPRAVNYRGGNSVILIARPTGDLEDPS